MRALFHHPLFYPQVLAHLVSNYLQHSSWYGWIVLGFWFSLLLSVGIIVSDWLVPTWFYSIPFETTSLTQSAR